MKYTPLVGAEVANVLIHYGVSASPELRAAIQRYTELLLRWNEKVALTAVRGPHEILRLHFGESMFAATAVPISKGRLADVGSGAGFPGLPLRLIVPGLDVTLIESNAKKAAFLGEVVRHLALSRVSVHRGRGETLPEAAGKFDFVTARAVGKYSTLLKWIDQRLTSRGQVVLWLGADDCAKVSASSSWIWRAPIPIPGSRNRMLLVGQPIRSCGSG